jgi:uncharacterized protein DUF5615
MLRLLLDENLNHRILRGLRLRSAGLDYVIVQNTELRGASDLSLLSWAAEHQRILVTHELKTIPKLAYGRVRAGEPMGGVIAIPTSLGIGKSIEELAAIVECCEQADLQNLVTYLPL